MKQIAKTTLSSMTFIDLSSARSSDLNGRFDCKSGFQTFLALAEVEAPQSVRAEFTQPTDFLGSVELLSGADSAWQSYSDAVRNDLCRSLGDALVLAMKPASNTPVLGLVAAAQIAA
jgi:hypothetical protein